MYIPAEFTDYLTNKEPLTPEEQESRLAEMRVDEIIFRAKIMAGLKFDRDDVKTRIKKNFQWAHELGELPACYTSIDSIVDKVYDTLKV